MQYTEDATQAANYLREAIPLMVKYGIHPNPRNFALWYAYVSKRNAQLNKELEAIVTQHNTCPPAVSADLFRRYIIDDEVDFAEQIQKNLSSVIGNLSSQTEHCLRDEQEYESQLHQGLQDLQGGQSATNMESVVLQLIEHTKQATKVAEQFRSEMNKANSEIEQLRQELSELSEQASLDGLTQLNNRRSFDRELKLRIDESNSSGKPLCLLISDIDHFKKCNDTYGHIVGDKVLQAFGKILSRVCENIGFAARFGGEEFVVILPDHALDQAQRVAEEIRSVTQAMKIKQRGSDREIDRITTSVGVALYQQNEEVQDYIGRADGALYQAKEAGRNCVVLAS